MPITSVARTAALLATLAAAGQAHATFTVYTTTGSFAAAISAPAVDSFDAISASFLPSPATRTAGAYSYTATASGDFDVVPHTATDNWLSTFSSVPVTLSGFSSTVRGIGGFVFGVDANDAVLTGRAITVQATDASGTVTRTINNASDTKFFGLTSDSAITSLVFSVSGSGAYVTFNDMAFGAAAVPEPANAALMLGGLAALLAASRWRARHR